MPYNAPPVETCNGAWAKNSKRLLRYFGRCEPLWKQVERHDECCLHMPVGKVESDVVSEWRRKLVLRGQGGLDDFGKYSVAKARSPIRAQFPANIAATFSRTGDMRRPWLVSDSVSDTLRPKVNDQKLTRSTKNGKRRIAPYASLLADSPLALTLVSIASFALSPQSCIAQRWLSILGPSPNTSPAPQFRGPGLAWISFPLSQSRPPLLSYHPFARKPAPLASGRRSGRLASAQSPFRGVAERRLLNRPFAILNGEPICIGGRQKAAFQFNCFFHVGHRPHPDPRFSASLSPD